MEKVDKGYASKDLGALKELMLKNWNIEFKMEGKSFSDLIKYIERVGGYVPCQFDENGLTIRDRSIQISHDTILHLAEDESLVEYKFNSGSDSDYVTITLDVVGFAMGVKKFFKKDEQVIIRIDSIDSKRAEFIFNNMTMWSYLHNPDYHVLPSLEKTMAYIADGLSGDNNIDSRKADFTLNSGDFARICRMGHMKEGFRKDSDKYLLLIADEKDGVFIRSGNSAKGRILVLTPPATIVEQIDDEEEYQKQLAKKAKFASISSKDTKAAVPKPTNGKLKSNHGKLVDLNAERPQSIVVDVEGIKTLGILPLVTDVKLTIVARKFVLMQTRFKGVKITCFTPALKI